MSVKHISNTKPHKSRNDLTGEYKWGDAGQLILFLIFMTVWIIDSFIASLTTTITDAIPLWIRLLTGITIFIIAFRIAKQGMNLVFGTKRDNPTVIREGVFGIVRHPIYLSAVMFYVSFIISTMSVLAFMVGIFIIGFYYAISRYEEKILAERFGDEYKKYMAEVPMLLPKPFRRVKSN